MAAFLKVSAKVVKHQAASPSPAKKRHIMLIQELFYKAFRRAFQTTSKLPLNSDFLEQGLLCPDKPYKSPKMQKWV